MRGLQTGVACLELPHSIHIFCCILRLAILLFCLYVYGLLGIAIPTALLGSILESRLSSIQSQKSLPPKIQQPPFPILLCCENDFLFFLPFKEDGSGISGAALAEAWASTLCSTLQYQAEREPFIPQFPIPISCGNRNWKHTLGESGMCPLTCLETWWRRSGQWRTHFLIAKHKFIIEA